MHVQEQQPNFSLKIFFAMYMQFDTKSMLKSLWDSDLFSYAILQ